MRRGIPSKTRDEHRKDGWRGAAEDIWIGWMNGVQVEIGRIVTDSIGEPIEAKPVGVRIDDGDWVPFDELITHVEAYR